MSFSLDGRRVLLTGAAGGIGRAIAKALHERGAAVVLSGRNVEGLEALRSELGDRAEVAPADLSDRASVAELAERAREADVLVANAALPGSGTIDSFSPEEIDRTLDVNLRAPIQLTRAFLPRLLEQGQGQIVFISSISGKIATPGSGLYSATKFGLRGFASGLRQDLHGTGVGVTVVYPGFVSDAGMWADTGISPPRGLGTRTPEQVADAVVEGIEKGGGEIDVAPAFERASARLAGAAPGVVAAISRRLAPTGLTDEIADAQRPKR